MLHMSQRPFLLNLLTACTLTVPLALPPNAFCLLAALSTLQYGVYSIAVESLEVGGVSSPPPATPCTNPSFPSACLPVIKAEEDSVTLRYGPAEGAPSPPPGALVSIYGCYSNVSSFNRPWRANGTRLDVLVRLCPQANT